MMGLSIRGYARHRGVSPPAVKKAIDSGRIHLESDGTIDPARADREWSENTNPEKQRNGWKKARDTAAPPTPAPRQGAPAASQPAPKKTAPPRPAEQSAPADDPETPSTQTNINKVLLAKEVVNVKLKQLELERESGKVVDKEKVRVDAFNAGRASRDALFAIAARISPTLVGMDQMQIEFALMDEFRRLADMISTEARKVTGDA